jgi:hypothetical protein
MRKKSRITMYPPMWGPFHWSLKHVAAWFWMTRATELEFETARPHLEQAASQTCMFLNCPACVFHCMDYHQQQVPTFVTPEIMWTYMLEFHNTVNARSKKRAWSDQEARKYQEDMETHHVNSTKHWIAVWLTTHTFTRVPLVSASSTDEQIKRDQEARADGENYLRYMVHMTYMLPCTIVDPQLGVRMRTWLAEQQALGYAPTTQNEAARCWIALFNMTQPFPRPFQEVEREWMAPFSMTPDSAMLFKHAEDKRLEDHKKIAELEQHIQRLTAGVSSNLESQENRIVSKSTEDKCTAAEDWGFVIMMAIILSTVAAGCIFALIYRRKTNTRTPDRLMVES